LSWILPFIFDGRVGWIPSETFVGQKYSSENQFYFIVITSFIATPFSCSMFPNVAAKAFDIKEGTQYTAIAFYTRQHHGHIR
jgi:hypothetical protein